MRIPKVGTRVIRVSGCHDCPYIRISHNDNYICELLARDYIVTDYYKGQILPDKCPLEKAEDLEQLTALVRIG
jgi:hypothetical protein